MIPEFDPQRTDQPVESWVRRIGRVLPLVRPDHRQVKLVANRPIGLARRWYDSQDCLAVSWKKNEKSNGESVQQADPLRQITAGICVIRARLSSNNFNLEMPALPVFL
jgi:hypothetical protein